MKNSIRYFEEQTYPASRRELLILDGEGEKPARLPRNCRYFQARADLRIGAKRNWLCEHAQGTIICHWDDDDYNAPGRIADQVERLLVAGAEVTGYHSMRFTDGQQWWQYRNETDYAIGTSLMYTREFWLDHPFPELQVGEDNHLVSRARAMRAIVAADAGTMQFATIHHHNTSPRNLGASSFQPLGVQPL